MPHRYLCLALLLTLTVPAIAAEPTFADRPMSAWVADLGDADPLIRDEAVEVLAKLGPAAKPVVSRLEALLASTSSVSRRRIAFALWKIDGRTDLAIDEYRAQLKSSRGRDKLAAIETLVQLGVPAKELAPHLTATVAEAEVSWYAASRSVAAALGADGAEALAAAIPKVGGDNRVWLVNTLASQGRDARPAILRLKAHLGDGEPRFRFAVARALWPLDDDRPALRRLALDAVAGKETIARYEAIQFALTIRPRPVELTPIFEAALKEKTGRLRFQAVLALYDLDPASLKQNLPILTEPFKQPQQYAEWMMAMNVIGAIGPAAKEALPAVLAFAETPNGQSYVHLIGPVVGRMGPDAIEPVLKLLARGGQTQQIGIAALAQFGAEHLAKLAPALANEEALVRRAVLDVFIRHAAECGPFVKELAKLVESVDGETRRKSLEILGKIGPDAAGAIPALVRQLAKSPAPSDVHQLAHVLGEIGPPAAAALPALRAALIRGDAVLRQNAVIAIGLIEGKKP